MWHGGLRRNILVFMCENWEGIIFNIYYIEFPPGSQKRKGSVNKMNQDDADIW
jgi:hypothetical protein